ncbi:hypothetical protein WMF11_06780 [Sorangium sp. So ce295]|uniref:hypothetical protein n=1 Tax=Sorangium sp. So ce295 TaxID=3133295 RepID=UPI003F5D8493
MRAPGPPPASVARLLERGVAPLDGARRRLFGLLRRSELAIAVVARPDRRIATLAAANALGAFTMAVFAPSALLVLGPILLGVLHVAADVRYLVLRRGLPSWWRGVVWTACAALVGLRGAQELFGSAAALLRAEHALLAAWLGAAVVAGALASRAWRRVALAAAAAVALSAAALAAPRGFRLVLAHAHNLVALALWLALFRRRVRAVAWPLGLVLAGTALLASGAMTSLTLRAGWLDAFGLHLLLASDWLAPGLPTRAAVALTACYAFLQSVHYAVWLLLIPQEDHPGQRTTTFRMSARSLRRDFGDAGLAAVAAVAGLVLIGALRSALGTRNLVLSLASFHGYLELALLAYFYVRGDVGRRAAEACQERSGRARGVDRGGPEIAAQPAAP